MDDRPLSSLNESETERQGSDKLGESARKQVRRKRNACWTSQAQCEKNSRFKVKEELPCFK